MRENLNKCALEEEEEEEASGQRLTGSWCQHLEPLALPQSLALRPTSMKNHKMNSYHQSIQGHDGRSRTRAFCWRETDGT